MPDEPAHTEPPAVLYGTQSRLSLQYFGSRGRCLRDVPALVRYYSLIKKAAAAANHAVGVLDQARATAITAACEEIAGGLHAGQFPTALVLGGGGTTTNMNVNEVIATRATQLAGITVHPNDHVNASQSTNDTFPTAMALTVMELAGRPLAALRTLADALADRAGKYQDTLYLGRTCLQDAVTVRAGNTLRAQARAIRRGAGDLSACVDLLSAVPLGATVLGTAVGAPAGFAAAAIKELSKLVDVEVTQDADPFDALAHLDRYAAVADAAGRVSATVAKIAADIRLRSSGPGGGYAEVTIPALQAGSSIMPAKINPIVPEYAMQLSYRIRGSAYTVGCAVAAGELEVNVMEPVIIDSILAIFDDLEHAASTMAEFCVIGLVWDGRRRIENASYAQDRWVELAAQTGYEAATNSAMENNSTPA